MNLLIVTQKVDRDDPVLGFFHGWLIEFAKHFGSVIVICLQEGAHGLPANVRVLSLGKEKLGNAQAGKAAYIRHFYRYIWHERNNYDAVFVHMNEEYVLLAGWLWRAMGKRVTMWRNHHAGSYMTDIAAFFCNKVFCTSKFSYTARYKKTELMPVGIDIKNFKIEDAGKRDKKAILFLGRIAKTKNVDIFIEALGLLKKKGVIFSSNIYGDALPQDAGYLESLRSRVVELGLDGVVQFHGGVPNRETPEIYNAHGVYVNLSSSGMYDKTIFEAMACGCLVLASNDNLTAHIDGRLIIENREAREVADRLTVAMSLPSSDAQGLISDNRRFAETQSLEMLANRLAKSLAEI